MLTEIFPALDVIHALVVGKHSDHLVVDFTTVVEGHHADDAGFHNRTGNQGLGDTNDFDVEGIAIFIPGAGNASVGEGVSQRGVTNAVQLEMAGFGDQLVLVDRVGVELHDRVETKFGFISEGRQHVQQVGHAAAGCLIEVGHKRRWTARRILRAASARRVARG